MIDRAALAREEIKLREFQSELLALGDEQAAHKPPNRWSIQEVIGHLIDSACNNHQRFIRLQQGPINIPGYDQNVWVDRNGYQERGFQDLVELWYLMNKHLIHVLGRVRAEAW